MHTIPPLLRLWNGLSEFHLYICVQVANYFEQNQADALDLDKTVDQTIMEASSTESYNQLRALMAQFLFKGRQVGREVNR